MSGASKVGTSCPRLSLSASSSVSDYLVHHHYPPRQISHEKKNKSFFHVGEGGPLSLFCSPSIRLGPVFCCFQCLLPASVPVANKCFSLPDNSVWDTFELSKMFQTWQMPYFVCGLPPAEICVSLFILREGGGSRKNFVFFVSLSFDSFIPLLTVLYVQRP